MKGRSIIEVLLVVGLWSLFGQWLFGELGRLGVGVWGQRYLFAVLHHFVTPIVILLIARRSFAAYGLTLKPWRNDLDVGLTCYLVALIPWGLGYGLITMLGSSYADPIGAIILSVAWIIASAILLSILRRREKTDRARTPNAVLNLIILGVLLLLPIGVGLYRNRLTDELVLWVIFLFFMSGFGEEMFYRGYVQSRINEEFGRPYQVRGVNFGPGLIIASLLFGLSHVLQAGGTWWWGVWTIFSGLFFGLIREKTGGIVASGIAHGGPDAVGQGLGLLFGWWKP